MVLQDTATLIDGTGILNETAPTALGPPSGPDTDGIADPIASFEAGDALVANATYAIIWSAGGGGGECYMLHAT